MVLQLFAIWDMLVRSVKKSNSKTGGQAELRGECLLSLADWLANLDSCDYSVRLEVLEELKQERRRHAFHLNLDA